MIHSLSPPLALGLLNDDNNFLNETCGTFLTYMYRMYALFKSSIPINALRNPFRYLLTKKATSQDPKCAVYLTVTFSVFPAI